jgi:hypothetical protein
MNGRDGEGNGDRGYRGDGVSGYRKNKRLWGNDGNDLDTRVEGRGATDVPSVAFFDTIMKSNDRSYNICFEILLQAGRLS